MKEMIATGPGWELREGRWQDVLGDVRGDAMITDPPYSKRNIAGYRSGSKARRRIREDVSCGQNRRYVIPYRAWKEENAFELAAWAVTRIKYWTVAFGDHIVWDWIDAAFRKEGWFCFAPVIWTKPNPPPRMNADGPCCAAEHILVARPRKRPPKKRRGSRTGWYDHAVDPVGGAARKRGPRLVGSKPVELMRSIIRDYTLPGDLIVDPCAGSGTTLLAAVIEGRRAIGAEMDPETFELARRRLERGFTPTLPLASEHDAEQLDLLGEE